MSANENRLKQIMADTFGITVASVNAATSVDTVETWDSLTHLNLVLALEEQFKIDLLEDQITEILSYTSIQAVLQAHGVSFER